jgi:hypothetical protein
VVYTALTEYQVVAGRAEREGQLGGYFAWVPQSRLCGEESYMKAALEANGWTPESQLRVLAGGADGLSNLEATRRGSPLITFSIGFTSACVCGRLSKCPPRSQSRLATRMQT